MGQVDASCCAEKCCAEDDIKHLKWMTEAQQAATSSSRYNYRDDEVFRFAQDRGLIPVPGGPGVEALLAISAASATSSTAKSPKWSRQTSPKSPTTLGSVRRGRASDPVNLEPLIRVAPVPGGNFDNVTGADSPTRQAFSQEAMAVVQELSGPSLQLLGRANPAASQVAADAGAHVESSASPQAADAGGLKAGLTIKFEVEGTEYVANVIGRRSPRHGMTHLLKYLPSEDGQEWVLLDEERQVVTDDCGHLDVPYQILSEMPVADSAMAATVPEAKGALGTGTVHEIQGLETEEDESYFQ